MRTKTNLAFEKIVVQLNDPDLTYRHWPKEPDEPKLTSNQK